MTIHPFPQRDPVSQIGVRVSYRGQPKFVSPVIQREVGEIARARIVRHVVLWSVPAVALLIAMVTL